MNKLSVDNKSLLEPPEIKGLDFSYNEKIEARKSNRILLLTVFTEMGCNFKCPYCFTKNAISSEQKALSLLEYEEIFKQAKDLGAKSVWWVGYGEPLLYKDIWEFLKVINSVGLIPIIFTNGSLVTEEAANRLFELGVSVYIKLNSLNNEIQDELVGNIKGASYLMKKGLVHLLNAGFNKNKEYRMGIQSVITKKNLKDIPKLYKLARYNNIIPFFEVIVYTGFPITQEVQKIDLTRREMKTIFEELLEIDQTEFGYTWIPSPPYVGKQCDKYYYSLTIDAYGNVLSCAASKSPIGSIRDKSINKLWNNPLLEKIKKMEEFIEGKCKKCEIDCTGCRAEAFSLTGNVFSEYKRCWR